MTDAIKSALKTFKRCKRHYLRWCNPKSFNDLEAAKFHLDNLIENETSKYWSTYMLEMSNSSSTSFWNKVKNITDHQSREITQPLFDNKGTLEWGDQEILNILVDKHIKAIGGWGRKNHAELI